MSTPESAPWESVRVLNLRVDAVTEEDVISHVLSWVDEPGPARLAVGVNAHACNQAARDLQLRTRMCAADLAYADGQSVVWAARLLGVRVPERVATTDFIHPLVDRAAAAGHRIFLYGGQPGVAERAAARLVERTPAARIDAHHGYVAANQIDDVIARINEFGTDILFVGLGDPLQQQWVDTYRSRLKVSAMLTCGGLFDVVSGRIARPPRWMARAGLEWLGRLFIDPGHVARRYLLGNPAFIARLARQYVRGRRIRSS
ncbi:WecB/TagA/CpsF family glycosyltransferase [Ruania halotolerans]|uniref:WecB/TagA/CpsF family glycosyltransferase n=1 Tax=Ruania halotolerans TaxID=2897773 RepID=UPI001E49C55D|nr:WecB/TagA/CpsF family glycosyltransferase [Ruania halotolerans]UFU05722.1 WecB/TagA/CpsF family glycosyltransferase [Ruania halotolerans]